MVCKGCHSGRVREYPAEINIHFAGKESLEKPSVWVFPNLIICVVCGFTEFRVPNADLQSLGGLDCSPREHTNADSENAEEEKQ
jgi:hypothetical protein